jgi:hypothetical protein
LALFGDLRSQRLMFRVLEGVRFYDGDLMRTKLREAHQIVRRGTRHDLDRRKRADILVSYLDGPGKSGARCANLYADEVNIYAANVVDPARLPQVLAEREEVRTLAFMDDFVGTGGTAQAGLQQLRDRCGHLLDDRRLVFVAMTGFVDARSRVQEFADGLGLCADVHLCDPLTDADRVFSDASRLFPDPGDRAAAHDIAHGMGVRLDSRRPLGHGDSQATVVFDEACPNNSLPILWERKAGFQPLFPRWTASG